MKNILSMKRLMAMGYGLEAKGDKLTIKNTAGKMLFICNQVEDRMFYLKGRRKIHAGIFNLKDGEWIDPVADSVENEGNTVKPVKVRTIPKTMTYDEAHDKWSHKGKRLLEITAKIYGILSLTGKLTPWEGCGYAQAKQRAVSKTTNTKASKPGKRIFLDMAGPYHETLGGKKYWFEAVNDWMGCIPCQKKSYGCMCGRAFCKA
jgi:hypothetical protein